MTEHSTTDHSTTDHSTTDHTLMARAFPDDAPLRAALAGNAVFSAPSGAVMVVGTGADDWR